MPKQLYIETVGCQMNMLDSELVVASLRKAGYVLVDAPAKADTILFNTCSVRQHAEDKIYSALGRLKHAKKHNPRKIIGVLGCMAQKDQKLIFERAPYVDLVVGPGQLHQIADLIEKIAAGAPAQMEVSLDRKAASRLEVERSFESYDPLRDPRRGGFPEDQHANLRFLSVPIHSRGKPIGALAFGRPLERPEVTERDAEAGRSLAGLIAIAIENRSLFEQTRHALSDLDALNRRLTGEAWATFSRRLGRDGAMWIGTGAEASQSPLPEVLEAQTSGRIAARPADAGRLGVAVPVRLRGEPIGVLRTSGPYPDSVPNIASPSRTSTPRFAARRPKRNAGQSRTTKQSISRG